MSSENKKFKYILEKAEKLLGNEFLLLKNAILMTFAEEGQKSYSEGYNAGRKRRERDAEDTK